MISLNLYTSILDGGGTVPVANLSNWATGWERSIKMQGGYWQGNFQLTGTRTELHDAFYTWMGYHLVERYNGLTSWEGLVYEMVLSEQGLSRIRSFDKMANAIKTPFTNAGTANAGSFITNTDSVSRYGRKEEILSTESLTKVMAEARQSTYLKENGLPWARGAGLVDEDLLLEVSVCGYVFTMNWKYLTDLSAGTATVNVSTWINSIISTDCQLVTPGTIQTNTLQVLKSISGGSILAWEQIDNLVKLGDSSGNYWRGYVGPDRLFNYEMLSNTIDYYWLNGSLMGLDGHVIDDSESWKVTPGVIRDQGYPIKNSETGGFLADARDMLAEEVSAGVGSGITINTAEVGESELLASRQDYLSRMAPPPKVEKKKKKANAGNAKRKKTKQIKRGHWEKVPDPKNPRKFISIWVPD